MTTQPSSFRCRVHRNSKEVAERENTSRIKMLKVPHLANSSTNPMIHQLSVIRSLSIPMERERLQVSPHVDPERLNGIIQPFGGQSNVGSNLRPVKSSSYRFAPSAKSSLQTVGDLHRPEAAGSALTLNSSESWPQEIRSAFDVRRLCPADDLLPRTRM
jgi:hypothetical protein